jgi:hypothetical protein
VAATLVSAAGGYLAADAGLSASMTARSNP